MPTKGSIAAGRVIVTLIVIIAIGWLYTRYATGRHPGAGSASVQPGGSQSASINVSGAVGGEKLGFLTDPQVIDILQKKYGLTVDADKEGSIDMVKGSVAGRDFLWPSSQVALELYKERGGKMLKSQTIFSSPIVLYSWTPVTQALVRAHVVQKIAGVDYVTDFPKLIAMINAGTPWKAIGLPDLYGHMSVRSTDPNKSNSGMMFAGLLANTAAGDVATDASLARSMPTVKAFFDRLGYMEGSSGDIFDQFITQGEGENPLMVGYENQLPEYTLAHSDYRAMIQQQITILYPRPTVWSDHPIIALTPNGLKLLSALQTDSDLRRLAWTRHGFRTGLQNDPAALQVTGIPATISNVVPMPRPEVVNRLLGAIAK